MRTSSIFQTTILLILSIMLKCHLAKKIDPTRKGYDQSIRSKKYLYSSRKNTCGLYCKMCDAKTKQCKFCTTHYYLNKAKGCKKVEKKLEVEHCAFYSNRYNCMTCEKGYFMSNEKCKACKDVDENLERCTPNLIYGKCKEGMVWEVSLRKCKKITEFGEFAYKLVNCQTVKPKKNRKHKEHEDQNIKCMICKKEYSQGLDNICQLIKDRNCLYYDFLNETCMRCSEGYRLLKGSNKDDDSIYGSNKNDKIPVTKQRSKISSDARSSKKNGKARDMRKLVNDANKDNCVKCAPGCSVCQDFAFKITQNENYKKCILCKTSESWPKWFHTEQGICKAYLPRKYNKSAIDLMYDAKIEYQKLQDKDKKNSGQGDKQKKMKDTLAPINSNELTRKKPSVNAIAKEPTASPFEVSLEDQKSQLDKQKTTTAVKKN